MDDNRRLVPVLQLYQQCWQQLPVLAHPSWLQGLWPKAAVPPRHALVRHLPAALGLQALSAEGCGCLLSALPRAGATAPAALQLLALLPAALCLRLLCLRALLAHASALRRCLHPVLWGALSSCVGPEALQCLLRHAPSGPDQPFAMPQINEALALQLAWQGYCQLDVEGQWQQATLRQLVLLRFARGRPPQPVAHADPDASAWLAQQLVTFLPELPWLSG
jgi:Bacterial type III secretion protein (HrpB4)